MTESILSAGIDIGTTTTQLIFSRLLVKNTSGFGGVPKIEIIDKEIIYRSAIYMTPLLSDDEINGDAVREIIKTEYNKAGITPAEVTTGAIIITGESSRKRNAKAVVHALSDIAGDFVVATAGPNLESVLAGKGSGAASLSEKTGKLVANLDIGGGITNICYFENGHVIDVACLDIGGRLIKITSGRISYISDKMKLLLEELMVSIKVGDEVDLDNAIILDQLTDVIKVMTSILEQAVALSPATNLLELMKTNQLIRCDRVPDIITFSGGIADCIRNKTVPTFAYDDIGVLLGEAISNSELFKEKVSQNAEETMNATVIGAGNFSMDVSGSTIEHRNCVFPYKNIPVVYVDILQDRLFELRNDIEAAVKQFKDADGENEQIALAFQGIKCPSYSQIEAMAEEITAAMQEDIKLSYTLILVIEADIGKALGQAVRRILPKEKALLCIDHISCKNGDYIDIGTPIASGRVVPVVVKTLIFNT